MQIVVQSNSRAFRRSEDVAFSIPRTLSRQFSFARTVALGYKPIFGKYSGCPKGEFPRSKKVNRGELSPT